MSLITNLSLVFGLAISASTANAQALRSNTAFEQDVAAIKSQAGCYDVTFRFFETVKLDPTSNITSPPYIEHGVEWVAIDEDSTGHIGLQHILVTGSEAMKHWRQTWDYQSTAIQEFQGAVVPLDGTSNLVWVEKTFSAESVAGQWRQQVSQVDDSPRYECSAPWIHVNGKSFWECSARAPLPRREFSQRSDYDILLRRNRHEILSWGWMHEEDNLKLLSSPRTERAMEKGYDSYVRTSDEKCTVAKTKWANEQTFWKNVRAAWSDIRAEYPRLELRKKANGTIYDYLFEMGEEPHSSATTKDAIRATLAPFIVVPQ